MKAAHPMYGRTKLKIIKSVEVELVWPTEEKPTIGKASPIEIVLRTKEPLYCQYFLFELFNERTDKRAPMDRITSRSHYLYRFNVEKPLDPNGENKYKFALRVPVHKEPSRNDKFICIKWQYTVQAILKHSPDDKESVAAQTILTDFEVV